MGFEDNAGKIKLAGWVVLVVMATLWLLLPLARGLINVTIKEEALSVFREVILGGDGKELLKTAIGFAVACVVIRIEATCMRMSSTRSPRSRIELWAT